MKSNPSNNMYFPAFIQGRSINSPFASKRIRAVCVDDKKKPISISTHLVRTTRRSRKSRIFVGWWSSWRRQNFKKPGASSLFRGHWVFLALSPLRSLALHYLLFHVHEAAPKSSGGTRMYTCNTLIRYDASRLTTRPTP